MHVCACKSAATGPVPGPVTDAGGGMARRAQEYIFLCQDGGFGQLALEVSCCGSSAASSQAQCSAAARQRGSVRGQDASYAGPCGDRWMQ